jgi:hypothetical protein
MTNDKSNFVSSYSQFLDNSGEHLTYAALSAYRNFSEELSEKEKLFFKKHLDLCFDCSARLKEVSNIEGDVIEAKSKVIGSIPSGLFRYAAAAIILCSVGFGAYFVFQNIQQKHNTTHTVVSEQQIAATTPDPEKFIPNQILENFIERTVRSAQSGSLLAPRIGDTITIPYMIKWDGPKNQYMLHVVNNNNIDVWKKTVSSNEIVLDHKLGVGLYYLKLEIGEKLTSVGKFVIVR